MPNSDDAVTVVMLEETITETGNENATGSDSSRVLENWLPDLDSNQGQFD